MISRTCAPFLAGIALATVPTAAALAQSLEEAVRACAAETDVLRRLQCYDRAAAELAGRPAPAPAAASTAVAPPEPAPQRASAAAEFGVHNGPLEVRRHVEPPREITATVTRIEVRRSDGLLIVSLDNDQVWVQNQAVEYFPLKVGDTVRIRAGALGSYMMFTPAKRTSRVSRMR